MMGHLPRGKDTALLLAKWSVKHRGTAGSWEGARYWQKLQLETNFISTAASMAYPVSVGCLDLASAPAFKITLLGE